MCVDEESLRMPELETSEGAGDELEAKGCGLVLIGGVDELVILKFDMEFRPLLNNDNGCFSKLLYAKSSRSLFSNCTFKKNKVSNF